MTRYVPMLLAMLLCSVIGGLVGAWGMSVRSAEAQNQGNDIIANRIRARVIETDTIIADNFELYTVTARDPSSGRNVHGQLRADLYTTSRCEPIMRFADATGRVRMAILYSQAGGPAFALLDDDNDLRAYFGTGASGDAQLVILDDGGRTLIDIAGRANGTPSIDLISPGTDGRIRFGFSDDSQPERRFPFIRLNGPDGQPVVNLPERR